MAETGSKSSLVEKIIDINTKISRSLLYSSFSDPKIEQDYKDFILDTKIKLNKISAIISITFYIFLLASFYHYYQTNYFLWILLSFLVIDSILGSFFFNFCKFKIKNSPIINFIYAVKFIFIYITLFFFMTITIMDFKQNGNNIFLLSRLVYLLIVIKNIFFFFIPSSCFLISSFLCLINVSYFAFIISFINQNQIYNFYDILLEIFLSTITYFIKRSSEEITRNTFIEKFKFEIFYNYCDNLIDGLNGFHVSFKNKEIVYINKFLKEELNKIQFEKNEIMDEDKFYQVCNDKNKNSIVNNQNIKNIYTSHNVNDFDLKKNEKFPKEKLNINENIVEPKNKSNFYSEVIKGIKIKLNKNDDNFNDFKESKCNSDLKIKNDKNPVDVIEKNILDEIQKIDFIKVKIFLNSLNPYKISDVTEKNYKSENFMAKNLLEIFKIIENTSFEFKDFIYLGQFSYFNKLENSTKYYLVYYRKFGLILDIIINDNTNNKLAEKALIENAIKHNLFSKIAHEFKTPINSIIGVVNTIKNNLSDKNNKKNDLITINSTNDIINDLNLIKNLSNYTIYLVSDMIQYATKYDSSSKNTNKEDNILNKDEINDFSDISKNSSFEEKTINNIENIYFNSNSKTYGKSKKNFELKKQLNFCFGILNALLSCNEYKKSSISTKLEFNHDLKDYYIKGDEFKFNQILINFLSNSIKFTRKGIIKIKCSLTNEGLEISVEDSGIGIKENIKEKIFKNEEYKVEMDTKYQYNNQGSGFGLSICKILANHLKYNLKFYTEPNIGSKFTIIIPKKCYYRNKSPVLRKLNFVENNPTDDINYLESFNSETKELENFEENGDFFYRKNKKHKTSLGLLCNPSTKSLNTNFTDRKIVETDNIISKFLDNTNDTSNKVSKNLYDFFYDYNIEKNNIKGRRNIKKKIFSQKKQYPKSKSFQIIEKGKFFRNNCIFPEKLNENESFSLASKSSNFFEMPTKIFDEENYIFTYDYGNKYISYDESDELSININLIKKKKTNSTDDLENSCFNFEKNDFEVNKKNDHKSKENLNNFNNENFISMKEDNNNSINDYNSVNDFNLLEIMNNNNFKKEKIYDKKSAEIKSTIKSRNIDSFNLDSQNKTFSRIFSEQDFNLSNDISVKNDISSNFYKIPIFSQEKKKYTNILSKFNKNNILNSQKKFLNDSFDSNIQTNIKSTEKIEQDLIYSINNGDKLENSDKIKIDAYLVVDDNKYIRDALKKSLIFILEENYCDKIIKNYKIFEAFDGIEALKIVFDLNLSDNYLVKLILIDENMEFLNGSNTIRIIRELEKKGKFSNTKIFSVTAFEDVITTKNIHDSGADLILNKPVSKIDLKKYMKNKNVI